MGRVVLQGGTSVDGLVVHPTAAEHEPMLEWNVRSVSEAGVRVYRPA